MTLASRLSTHANLGSLDDKKQLRSLFAGNFYLVQFQGTTIGLIASLVTLSIGSFIPSDVTSALSGIDLSDAPLALNHSMSQLDSNQMPSSAHYTIPYLHFATVLISGSVFTVCIASLILSVLIFALVAICTRYQYDPDNVAIPLAASVGDFITLLLYVVFCTSLHDLLTFRGVQTAHYALIGVWGIMALLVFLFLPWTAVLASKSKQTARLLYNGWYSILAGMALQTLGGLIMENSLQFYPFVPLFQPILNGKIDLEQAIGVQSNYR
jgi:solute carrier family 41